MTLEEQLAAEAQKLDKSLTADKKEEPKEESAMSLLSKCIDFMGKAVGMRKAVEPDDDDHGGKNEHDRHKDGEHCKACGFGMGKSADLRKSGEDQQEHGDQHHLNTGPMSGKRMKVINYDAKTGTAEIENVDDAYGNAAPDPYPTQHDLPTHKSIKDTLVDADTTEDDKMMIVNDILDEQIRDTKEMQKAIKSLQYSSLVLMKGIQSLMENGNAPRGRRSATDNLFLLDKSVGGDPANRAPGSATIALKTNPQETRKAIQRISAKALEPVTMGDELFTASNVSFLENCLNAAFQCELSPAEKSLASRMVERINKEAAAA